nr:competence protein CoiA family protein [Bacillus sp. FJAT-47783]
MQSAVNKFEKIVYAWEDLSQYEGKFFCPHCKSELIYRNGNINCAHFAHKSLRNCPYSGHHESEEHIRMKKNLFNFLKKKYPNLKIELEKCLVPNRRADLVIYGESQTLVVEFQASSIDFDEIKERTKDYNKLGYPVLWIFHIGRFGYKYFPSEEKEKSMPYELIKMGEMDSLFAMDDKGFIRRCSLGKRKKNTKSVHKNKFFPVKMEFRFNKVFQKNNDESLFLCQLGGDSIYSEKNLYYGYWLLKGKTERKNIIFKLKNILPSNVFFKVENVKYHKSCIEFQLFMNSESSSIKTDGLLITKEKMTIESVLDRLKKPTKPKPPVIPLPVKDEAETVMKEVAVSSELVKSKSNIKIEPTISEEKRVIEIQQETESRKSNLLTDFIRRIKKILRF